MARRDPSSGSSTLDSVTALPDAVRARIVALAADVLGTMETEEVPPPLRPVARFASAKRARAGGSAIAAALETDSGFRGRVLEAATKQLPGLAEALADGSPPPAADPVEVAAVAYLLRPEGWEQLVDAAREDERRAEEEARQAREAAAAERLREQLTAARASAREARERYRKEISRLKAENASLRRRLEEARTEASSARAAEQEAASAVEQAAAARSSAEADARRLRTRIAEAEAALEESKRSAREDRGLETARLGLLLETLAEAATGLRRELALPATSARPADAVPAAGPSKAAGPDHGRARAADEPAYLAELLTLPKVHLVVDGYNVTKAAWPTMPLEGQRTRLVQALGALASRTGAEITCVFDGADVSVPPPVKPAAGVRVRFSPPGETADEVVRRLVRAEPEGRPVVVVSSDRELARSVQRPGVRTAESAALIGTLAG